MYPEEPLVDNTARRQLQQACAELERRLRVDSNIDAAEILLAFPAVAENASLAIELIYTEFVAREELGQNPVPQQFYTRYPQWQRELRQVFEVDDLAKTVRGGSLSVDPEATQEFADNVHRNRSAKPVVARPAGHVRRLAKWARRQPAFAALALIALCLPAVVVGAVLLRNMQLRTENVRLNEKITRETELRRTAQLANRDLQQALHQATLLREKTEQQVRIATAGRLAAQSRAERETKPVQSVLSAMDAAKTTMDHGEPVTELAEAELRASLQTLGGLPLPGHQAPIRVVAFTPDSRWLATASTDGIVHLRDMRSENPTAVVQTLNADANDLRTLLCTPDGQSFITGHFNGEIRIWTLQENGFGSEPLKLEVKDLRIGYGQMSVSANGQYLLVTGYGKLHLWDLHRGAAPVDVNFLSSLNISLGMISANGQWLAVACSDNTVRICDLHQQDRAAGMKVIPEHGGHVNSLAFGPDNHSLLVGNSGWHLWNISGPFPVREAFGFGRPAVERVVLTPGGQYILVTTGALCRAWSWPKAQYKYQWQFPSQHADITALVVNRTSTLVAIGDREGGLRIGKLEPGNDLPDSIYLRGHDDAISELAFSEDQRWLVSVGQDARLWDLQQSYSWEPYVVDQRSGRRLVAPPLMLDDGDSMITALNDGTILRWQLHGDGRPTIPAMLGRHKKTDPAAPAVCNNHWLACASGNTVELLNLVQAKPSFTKPLKGVNTVPPVLAISPSGNWLLVKVQDQPLEIWNPLSNRQVKIAIPITIPGTIKLSVNDQGLVASCAGGVLQVWQLNDEKATAELLVQRDLKTRLPMPDELDVAFSPAQRWLLVNIPERRTIYMWDLAPSRKLSLHPDVSLELPSSPQTWAISSDDQRLAVSMWHSIGVYDLNAVDVKASERALTSDDSNAKALAFSHDLRWLASTFEDGLLCLWDLRAEDPNSTRKLLSGPRQPQQNLMFDSSGRWLVSYDWDSVPRLWRLRVADLLAAAKVATNTELVRHPAQRLSWFEQGMEAYKLGLWEPARVAFAKAIESDPQHAEAWFWRGWAAAKQGQWDKAESDFRRTTELRPDMAWAWCSIGHAQCGYQKWEDAARAYSKALDINPDYIEALTHRARCYAESGQWTSAISDYQRMVALTPEVVDNSYCLAIAHLAAGQPDEARRVCGEMLSRCSGTNNANLCSQTLYATLTVEIPPLDSKELIPVAEVAVQAFRGNQRILGAALYRAGQHAAARDSFAESSKYYTQRAWDFCFLAMIHHHLGNHEQSRWYLANAEQWIETANRPATGNMGAAVWMSWMERIEVPELLRQAKALINETQQ